MVVIHVTEGGQVDVISSSKSTIIVIDDRVGDEYQFISSDDPEMVADFVGHDSLCGMLWRRGDRPFDHLMSHEDQNSRPTSPHLKLVQ